MFDVTGVTEFIQIITELPTPWKIVFAVVFFLIPKLIHIIGGNKVLASAIAKAWEFNVEVVRRYQARQERRMEDEGLTEAYTRTLVIESLNLFGERLRRMDHKVNHILLVIDRGAELEVIEATSPHRKYSDTIIHDKIHKRLAELRQANEEKDD